MTFTEIQKMPTCFSGSIIDPAVKKPLVYNKAHESLLRSFQIVRKVKELLELETPPSVVLELIHLMEGTE